MSGTVPVADRLAWVATGTKLCQVSLQELGESAYRAPSALPGWSRRHLVAHLAANAEALGRLAHWARTGEETPMYSSPEQRAADIESGATLTGTQLTEWFERSADELADRLETFPPDRWGTEVVTAQGRAVPAMEIPWLRAREVMVHAVDLDRGTSFADLPEPFLHALRDDISRKRETEGVPDLIGPLPEVVAYLTGRASTGVTTADGAAAPTLAPWL